MASPMPLPAFLVVKYNVKIFSFEFMRSCKSSVEAILFQQLIYEILREFRAIL